MGRCVFCGEDATDRRMLDLALFEAGVEIFRLTNRCPFEVKGYDCGADEPCEDQTDAPECWSCFFQGIAEKAVVA